VSHKHYPAFCTGDVVTIDRLFDFFLRELNRLTIARSCVGVPPISAADFFGEVWRAKDIAAIRSRE
jgi:hypothetical protein